MNKMRLRSRRKVFKKFGSNLTINENGKLYHFKLQKSLKRINKFSPNETLDLTVFNYSMRTSNILMQKCVICGTDKNVEMHHRRPLRTKSTDNTLKGIKINLTRKQIPLCKQCHTKVHTGKYDGPGIY